MRSSPPENLAYSNDASSTPRTPVGGFNHSSEYAFRDGAAQLAEYRDAAPGDCTGLFHGKFPRHIWHLLIVAVALGSRSDMCMPIGAA